MKKSKKKEEEKEEEGEEEDDEEEEEEDVPLEPKTFGRSNRGRMIQKMIATQPAADEFWDEKAQQFFAEEENDNAFDVALDPDAKYVDKVDSDFDQSESSAESEEEEEEKREKKRSLYQDPRNKKPASAKKSVSFGVDANANASATATATAAAPKQKREYTKKTVVASDRVVRTSTKQQTEVTNISASIAKKTKRKNAKRVVRVYTQEELLREADKTERLNIMQLHKIKAWEAEEKAKRKPKGPILSGPRVVYHSKGNVNTVTFKDCDGLNVLPLCFSALEGKTNEFPTIVERNNEFRAAASISFPEFVSANVGAEQFGAAASPSVPPPPPPAFVQRPKAQKQQPTPKVSTPKISPKAAVSSIPKVSPKSTIASSPKVSASPTVSTPKVEISPKVSPKVSTQSPKIGAAPKVPKMVATKRDVAPKEPNPKKQKVGKAVKQQVKTPETSRPVDGGSTSRSGRVIKKSKLGDDFEVLD